ncbi:MAG: phytoene/squalene synthase family protein [Gammaproteobacteria bacterium]|nr:phytoene/squalene synthase family protein [Gammaproteobacteria bacterium]MCY4218319.1 phytoene/squalene synthase family protein [Gammaproteobacteria bacterium]MCY4275962.1 phytoene/squalene synthase family protein [Gammaproteobacteria bacterium]
MIESSFSEQAESDLAYQNQILVGVSRTFALTIPQLPDALQDVVGNAYLLCRIADTIEDEQYLDIEKKHQFTEFFIRVVSGEETAEKFAKELLPLLSLEACSTNLDELDLVENTPRVIRITHSFTSTQRIALERCVKIMSRGMVEFQKNSSLYGLEDLPEMARYCYVVAGVVGEMLATLFCEYSEQIAEKEEVLQQLSVSFGQGLQMTNILKDVWEDRKRNMCWLPRSVFADVGFTLSDLSIDSKDQRYEQGLTELVGVARNHLENALRFTLLIPKHEKGIRRFCLWALAMAILSLRKIHAYPGYRSGSQVKITRRSVKLTAITMGLLASSDRMLQILFRLFTKTLPHTSQY